MVHSVDIDPAVLALLAGLIVPLLTGLVTKLESSQGLKRIVCFVLAALAGAATQVIAVSGHVNDVKTLVISTAIAFGSSVAIYYGVWKPAGVSNAINTRTAKIGL